MKRNILAIFTAVDKCKCVVACARIRFVVVIEERVGWIIGDVVSLFPNSFWNLYGKYFEKIGYALILF